MSKALATKNVAAALLGFAMIASTFAFATPVNAQSSADLQAQINALLAQIAALQGGSQQTGGLKCTATFTLNLKVGSRGSEVMALQKFLNSVDGTQVAVSGAGSPGNETSYFGPATKAAVIKFQDKYAADILTPVGLSKGTGNWFASTRAKANALCASAPTTPTTPTTPVSGTLQVMAASQPANSLAPDNAARVPFTTFTLTNSSNAAVTVSGVTVQRTGLSDDLNFASVTLIDEMGLQLGIARILNSNHQATVGDNFVINPGQTKTLTVVGNMDDDNSTRSGQVVGLSVVGINASGTVSGSLPISGASHTINASLDIGTALLSRGSTDPNTADGLDKEAGTTGYTFASVKVQAGSAEDIRVSSIRWNQSGSADTADLANVVVIVDGVSYPTSVQGKYYIATFPSGVVIAKGLSKEFAVKADIVGGAGRTVAFEIYRTTDIAVMGMTYGYGITTTDGGSGVTTTSNPIFPDTAVGSVDITAGSFSAVSKSNVVPTGNVAEQVANTNLGAFTVDIKGEAVQVQTVKFGVQISGGVADAADITNVTLVNQNGVVLAGPVNGVADGFESTGDATGEGSFSFNAVTFPVGTTVVTVKGQLGSDFANTNTVQFTTNPTDWTSAVGQNTGNNVTFPNSLSQANVQTLQAASLVATNLSTPAPQSVVKGASDFIWTTAALDASSSGEDIRVTSISITDTTSADGGLPGDIDNVEIWANLTGGSANDSVVRNNGVADRFETKVSNTEQFTSAVASADETLVLALQSHITIPRNTSIEIAVVADLASNASGTVDTQTHTIDVESVTAAGLNTGVDSSDTSVAGVGQAMTITAGGAVTITVDSSSPVASLLLDIPTAQTVAVFRLAGSNVENFDVDSLVLTEDGDDQAASSYELWVGGVMKATAVNAGGTATFNLNNGTITIPQNGNVLVTVKAVINDIDGTQLANGGTIQPTIAAAGDLDVTGNSSSSTPTPTLTSGDPAIHTIYEAFPVVSFVTDPSIGTAITLSANQLVAKIGLTNSGTKDVTYQSGDTNLFSIQVQVVGDDALTDNQTVTLKDQDGTTLDTGVITSATGVTQIDFDMSSVGATVGTTIPAGQTKYFYVYADTSDLEDNGNVIQVWLDDTAADNTFGVNGTGAFAEGDAINKGDLFGPVLSRSI